VLLVGYVSVTDTIVQYWDDASTLPYVRFDYNKWLELGLENVDLKRIKLRAIKFNFLMLRKASLRRIPDLKRKWYNVLYFLWKCFNRALLCPETTDLGSNVPTLFKTWSRINVTSELNICKMVRKTELIDISHFSSFSIIFHLYWFN